MRTVDRDEREWHRAGGRVFSALAIALASIGTTALADYPVPGAPAAAVEAPENRPADGGAEGEGDGNMQPPETERGASERRDATFVAVTLFQASADASETFDAGKRRKETRVNPFSPESIRSFFSD